MQTPQQNEMITFQSVFVFWRAKRGRGLARGWGVGWGLCVEKSRSAASSSGWEVQPHCIMMTTEGGNHNEIHESRTGSECSIKQTNSIALSLKAA